MIAFKRGDVLIAEVSFTGPDPGVKRRPIIVLSTTAFHSGTSKLFFAGVTSNLNPPERPGDVTLQDWQQAGLAFPSAVRGIFGTTDQTAIFRQLGTLSPADLKRVEQDLPRIIGLITPRAIAPSE